MKTAACFLVMIIALLAGLQAAHAEPTIVHSLATPNPTQIQLIAAPPVPLGNPTTLMGVLHDKSTNQGISGMTLTFYILTTFGWLSLGNQTTDDSGKAAIDYTPESAATYTARVVFNGNATHAPCNATATFTILPAAPTQSAGLPTDTVIALVILVVVAGVWSTYGFVAWQVAGIRSDRPERAEGRRRKSTEVKKTMEEESQGETTKRAPGSATSPNRTVLILAIVALLLGASALAVVGVQTLGKTPAYTPGTVNLQVAVVPDLQGDQWDVWLPNELVVHLGDTVKLTIINSDQMSHGFQLDAFGVNQALQPASNSTGPLIPSKVTITFTASQVGSFQFKCNIPCGFGHDYMVGTFVVLPD